MLANQGEIAHFQHSEILFSHQSPSELTTHRFLSTFPANKKAVYFSYSRKGAYVIGTASNRNQDFVRKLGADETLDYQTTRFEDVVHDIDVVFDTIGGETQKRSWRVLKKGGILVFIVGPLSAEEATAHGVRQASVFVQPSELSLQSWSSRESSGLLSKPFCRCRKRVMPTSSARQATREARSSSVL